MGNVFRATQATRLRGLGVTSPRFAKRPPTLGGAPTGFAFPTSVRESAGGGAAGHGQRVLGYKGYTLAMLGCCVSLRFAERPPTLGGTPTRVYVPDAPRHRFGRSLGQQSMANVF